MFSLAKKLREKSRKIENDYLRLCMEDIKNEKCFVEFKKDSTSKKIKISGFKYAYTNEHIEKRHYFDLYYIPSTQEYIFNSLFAYKNLESAKEFYDICMEKLKDSTYWARKINNLRQVKIKFDRRQKAIEESWNRSQEEIEMIAGVSIPAMSR
ncbi:MAG: hypothetical protein IKZ49_02175 [Alphaproteobacteria bacterium]|nr:hypothetical protein [Alphaproteobacteria bacterium]